MDSAVRLADAGGRGLTRALLRTPPWEAASHGLYARRETVDDLAGLCRATALVLPAGAAYSHLTAAALRGVWLPQLPSWLPLIATSPPGATRPHRRGLWIARARAATLVPELVEGAPCVPVPAMVGQLAEDLALVDLVIALDFVLHQRLCSIADLWSAIKPRQRGAPLLRVALTLADGRSESAWETVLRLLHVFGGFTDVLTQRVIRSADGAFVARADLSLTGTCRLVEYDGAHHRDQARHEADLRREKAIARAGFERYGYVKGEIVDTPGAILRDAEDAYGLAHDPLRLREWWPAFEASSISPTGWNRWLRRLRRYTRSNP